jgi:drug/metabolite transporter (DMT)-like permease
VTVNGLPLHPLVIHATVVALPIFAILSVAYLRPRWRAGLRWPLAALAVVSAVLVWFSGVTGHSLKHDRFSTATGVLAQRIQHHQDLAGKLSVATYALAVVAVVMTVLRGRLPGWLTWLGSALLVVGAIAVVVLCVLTGDAGARAAWGQ